MLGRYKQKVRGALDAAQRFSETDVRYLARGGFWMVLQQVIGTGGSLALSMVYARMLEKSVFGTFSFVTSTASIFSLFALTGVFTALVRSVAQGFEGDLQRSYTAKLKWGILSALGALGAAVYYFWQGNAVLGFSFIVVAALLPFSEAGRVWNFFLTGKKLFSVSTALMAWNKAVSIGAIVITLFFTQRIEYLLLAYFLPGALLGCLFLLLTIRHHQTNRRVSAETIPYAKHLTLNDILAGINDQIDNILVFHFLGAVPLAVYRFATVPVVHARMTLKSIIPLSLPKFAARSYREIYQTIGRRLLAFGALIAAGSLLYIALAPWLFRILFPLYGEAVIFSQVLALSLLGSTAIVPSTIWRAKREVKTIYAFTTITSAVRLGLLVTLIPLFGLWGAIAVRIGQYLIGGGITLWYFFRSRRGVS